ncbi:MAG: hypothetical protein IJE05_03490 [Clostridia bacterium]|nr:hypothetical protein [Clostridia bacterium]
MKESKVILKWKRNGEFFQRELEREEIFAVFDGFIKSHPENCEISKKIVKILPEVDKFIINWDSTVDVKELYYKIGDKTEGIPIIYHHKMVWGQLDTWCTPKKKQ